MRVFLSHSSRDKGFVEATARLLRPGTFELDALTFDAGLVNSEAIIKALKRCDLFCLFLSKASASSRYVDFEVLLGLELIANGRISQLLVLCLDNEAFNLATENIRYFNIIRKGVEPESAARLIQGTLISASQARGLGGHPFLGREAEMVDLEKQVTDHRRPAPKVYLYPAMRGPGVEQSRRSSSRHSIPT